MREEGKVRNPEKPVSITVSMSCVCPGVASSIKRSVASKSAFTFPAIMSGLPLHVGQIDEPQVNRLGRTKSARPGGEPRASGMHSMSCLPPRTPRYQRQWRQFCLWRLVPFVVARGDHKSLCPGEHALPCYSVVVAIAYFSSGLFPPS